MKCVFRPFSALLGVLMSVCIVDTPVARSQTQLDLQAFGKPANGWQAVGDVSVPFAKPQTMTVRGGDGVFAFVPARRVLAPDDLVTSTEYGDIELELDYLLAAGAQATISLQDVYDLVIKDDQGTLQPTTSNNGGVLGYAPRQQVSKAPGLWQNLKITFRAPKFDQAGVKTEPARLLTATLNGVTIHDNVQLRPRTGVSETARGPLRIGSVAGAIAFRNVQVNTAEITQRSAGNNNQPNPILVDAQTTRVLRSFVDIPGRIRVVHAVSVGHPQQVHYSYDMDHGNLVQAWRGDFLDATPMWHNRGNGTARALGTPIYFGTPTLAVAQLNEKDTAWPTDTAGTGYRPRGYQLDQQDQPTFNYDLYSTTIEDKTVALHDGTGLSRTVQVANAPADLYLQLAADTTIEDQGNGVYLVGDKAWFIKVEDSGKDKPFIRSHQDRQELLVPIRTSVRYSIIF